jgi:hypothetical protein
MNELSSQEIEEVSGGFAMTEYFPSSLDAIYIKPAGASKWWITGSEPYIPVNPDDY